MKSLNKLYQLRESLENWEKEIGINELSEKSKIIFSYLLTVRKFPITINAIKENEFISSNMSIASFNRSIKELLIKNRITIIANPMDKRSQMLESISVAKSEY